MLYSGAPCNQFVLQPANQKIVIIARTIWNECCDRIPCMPKTAQLILLVAFLFASSRIDRAQEPSDNTIFQQFSLWGSIQPETGKLYLYGGFTNGYFAAPSTDVAKRKASGLHYQKYSDETSDRNDRQILQRPSTALEHVARLRYSRSSYRKRRPLP